MIKDKRTFLQGHNMTAAASNQQKMSITAVRQGGAKKSRPDSQKWTEQESGRTGKEKEKRPENEVQFSALLRSLLHHRAFARSHRTP
jgi:hypothetical protein